MSKSDKSNKDTSASETKHRPKPAPVPLALLIATRKGAFFLRGNKSRESAPICG